MSTLGPGIDDVRLVVRVLQSRTWVGTDAGRNCTLTRSAARPRSGDTTFLYSGAGAGVASEHCTFTYLRRPQVPAGKTTSREPFANLSLASR